MSIVEKTQGQENGTTAVCMREQTLTRLWGIEMKQSQSTFMI